MKPFNLFVVVILSVMAGGFIFYTFSGDSDGVEVAVSPQNQLPTTNNTPSEDNLLNQDFTSYVNYSQSNLEIAKLKGDTVLFFAATTWCQTCAALEEEIIERIGEIPEDITILKVDYDNDREMNRAYSVTAQHTLIVLDGEGNEVDRWIGGGLNTLLQKTSQI